MGLLNLLDKPRECAFRDPDSAEPKGIHHSIVEGIKYVYILPITPNLVYTGIDNNNILFRLERPGYVSLTMNRMSHVMAPKPH